MPLKNRRGAAGVFAATLALVLTACTSGAEEPDAAPTPTATTSAASPATDPVVLRLGVYGPDGLLTAYQELADAFVDENPDVEVELVTFPDHDTAMAAYDKRRGDGKPTPDVFLIEHADLPVLLEREWIQPVDALLGERGVDFGDGYQREGMTAFSADLGLQCMPHDVSPMVVYYNTDLVDLSTIGEDPDSAPTPADGWTFEQFAEAARSVSTRRVKGVHVDPDLEQLAPFLWSGGGGLLDDASEPTRLDLSSDDNRETLEEVLTLLREERVTPSPQLLERRDPLQLFAAGRLGMLLGYRDLVPELRAMADVRFDVMPLPRVGSYRTVSSLSGYCLASDTDHVQEAADLLTFVVGDAGETIVTRAGYTLPANLEVAYSPAFRDGAKDPQSSFVFNEGVRRSEQLPTGPQWESAMAITTPLIRRMLYAPVVNLERLTERIDDVSKVAFTLPQEESDADGDDESVEDDG
ncbi:extracellular solute-binding protein [Nocardioides massiliensis]|uniref:Multiple sugar transport system substrate-binding protein n=1 Tax=Nocardioides massiliensis TaxID=1325935 RepID=A0ABT9NSH4_9ACTN|nr:extracellular solute-binding protein [Nocardioides massiliensis]MDP9823353.1 multiple sugar transport system substrate-binding protein [Nocardioides massiliensis]